MIGIFKSKVVSKEPEKEAPPSVSEQVKTLLLDLASNLQSRSSEAQKISYLTPAILRIIKLHEDSGDLIQAKAKQRMVMNVFHRSTDQPTAPLQITHFANSSAYDFFVEQVLTGHIFERGNFYQPDREEASGRFREALRTYVENSFNNLLVASSGTPYSIESRLNSIGDCLALSTTPPAHHHMLFHLIRAPDFNPQFFKAEHRDSLVNCLRGLREGYRALRAVFEEDCDYFVRSESKAINELLKQGASGLQMQSLAAELNQSWVALASQAREHLANPYIWIESSPCTGGGATVSQGEIALVDINKSKYGLRTFGAQNCVILAVLIYKDQRLSNIALAHIDPNACPKSISKMIEALNKIGQAKFAVVGGGLFNSFRISQLLEDSKSDFKTFLPPPTESRYSALHSLSAELSNDGKLKVYSDPASARDRKKSIIASDYQRLWDLDRSLCWLAD